MTPTEFDSIDRGDIVRHKLTGESYLVLSPRTIETDTGFTRVIFAIREIEVTNPTEWSLVFRATEIT